MAPVALTQLLLPGLRASGGAVLSITSDAAVEAYAGWGGYGAAKAALEQACHVLAAEEAAVRVWWVDPGDLRTQMHQQAFPGEDISDRPLPETVTPAFMRLIGERMPSGRYRAAELMPAATMAAGAVDTVMTSALQYLSEPPDRRDSRPAADCGRNLQAHEPPEVSGRGRDDVRLMVSRTAGGDVSHHAFAALPDLLLPGDLVVVNNSATLPAAVAAG